MHINMRVYGIYLFFFLSYHGTAAFSDPPFDSRVLLTETHALNLFSLASQEPFSP